MPLPTTRRCGLACLIITMAAHGWQPVPVVVRSAYSGADPVTAFNERACASGTLGILPAQHLMPLVLANALRLTKFGA